MANDCYQAQAHQYLFNTYARYPITIIKGKGAYLWDVNGKKYLDFLCGVGCTPLGHSHSAVTTAIKKQINNLLHVSNLYYSPPSIELAKWLVNNGGLDKIFFCNSGTEANEGAIKLARKFHWLKGDKDKNIILSVTNSFHGRTLGALAATAKPKIQEGFHPLPLGFNHQNLKNVNEFCKAINDKTAAVILEPVQGESGIHVMPSIFLKTVRETCDKTGTLLVFDEVQCGLGRTGELFAYQQTSIKPDIITLAKGIANGLPLGAICAQKEVTKALTPGDHGTTFGGNPVSCSAALVTLNIINQKYLHKIKLLSAYLFKHLEMLKKQYAHYIKEVRGAGLMVGVELTVDARKLLSFCQEEGLLCNVTGENVIRMLPPYIISKCDIDFAIKVIGKSLQKL